MSYGWYLVSFPYEKFRVGNFEAVSFPPIALLRDKIVCQIERPAANWLPVALRPAAESSGCDFLALR